MKIDDNGFFSYRENNNMELEDIEEAFDVDLNQLLEEQWSHFPESGEELRQHLVKPQRALFYVVVPHYFSGQPTVKEAFEDCKSGWPNWISSGAIRLFYAQENAWVSHMSQFKYWHSEEESWEGSLGVRLRKWNDATIEDVEEELTKGYPSTDYED